MFCYWRWHVAKAVFGLVLFLFTDDSQRQPAPYGWDYFDKAVTVKTPLCFPCIEDDEKALNPCRQRLARLDLHGTIAGGADKTEEKHFENDWFFFKENNNNNSILQLWMAVT